MGIFGNSSPFDADVERATSENNTSEEWGLILEICDRAGVSATAARDCLRAIMRRLAHPDPHVQVHAATLLDACVANCGRVFHLEVASREFETEFRRLVSRAQPAVASKLRAMLRKWAEGEFRNDPQLDLIPALSKQLRADHEDHKPERAAASTAASAAAEASRREQEELERAIALSLRESGATAGAGAGAGPSLYPRVEGAGPPAPAPAPAPTQPLKKVRALYDFEAAEDNELTFTTGDIIQVTDCSDPNWWKGQTERGEGLFPANFVTSDLTEPVKPETQRTGKTVQFAANIGPAAEEPPVEIDEAAMDAALAMLHDADVEARGDEEALQALESRVLRMGPLVDSALERADTRHARLTALSGELVRALNLYHELMRDPKGAPHPPAVGGPMGGAPPPPPPFMPPYAHTPPQPRC